MKLKIIASAFAMALCFLVKANSVDSIKYGVFGRVYIYHPTGSVSSVVMFVSGDSGWDSVVINMSKYLLKEGSLVVGIDIRRYYASIKNQTSGCYYPAGDFENLSLMLQKKYNMPQYLKPILIGYSAGATLVYGAAAQAPSNTFKGVIALSFCPELDLSKPLCKGNGLNYHALNGGKSYYLESDNNLTIPFIVLHGTLDQVCSSEETRKFMQGMKYGELVLLPKVGHGFAVHENWIPQFLAAYKKIADTPAYTTQNARQKNQLQSEHASNYSGNLPLTVLQAATKDTLPLAFIISGDGGWNNFEQSFSEKLVEKGISVVGLDAQKYFWNKKTPEQTTQDISKALEYYMTQWKIKKFIFIGYSFGADIVPFVTNRLSNGLKHDLNCMFAMSPDENGDFEIHVTDMFSLGNSKDSYDVAKEVGKIKETPVVCIFGDKESESLRELFAKNGAKITILPGKHHYGDNYKGIADAIFTHIKQ